MTLQKSPPSEQNDGLPPHWKELFSAALIARTRSYSPYSQHKVGAAIRLSDGRIFSGCNVENSSYGATVCAERVAIQKAVSESNGRIQIREVLVVTDSEPGWPPCGMCRQVIAEFGPESKIVCTNLQGSTREFSLEALFPQAFTPDHLKSPSGA